MHVDGVMVMVVCGHGLYRCFLPVKAFKVLFMILAPLFTHGVPIPADSQSQSYDDNDDDTLVGLQQVAVMCMLQVIDCQKERQGTRIMVLLTGQGP